jgi:hypothetical protein
MQNTEQTARARQRATAGQQKGITAGVCRCWDAGCSEKEDCQRWLARRTGLDHCGSLKPYDEPIGDACPLRIPRDG